jgi:hypothetical protein
MAIRRAYPKISDIERSSKIIEHIRAMVGDALFYEVQQSLSNVAEDASRPYKVIRTLENMESKYAAMDRPPEFAAKTFKNCFANTSRGQTSNAPHNSGHKSRHESKYDNKQDRTQENKTPEPQNNKFHDNQVQSQKEQRPENSKGGQTRGTEENRTCYICGDKGHISTYCPNKKRIEEKKQQAAERDGRVDSTTPATGSVQKN